MLMGQGFAWAEPNDQRASFLLAKHRTGTPRLVGDPLRSGQSSEYRYAGIRPTDCCGESFPIHHNTRHDDEDHANDRDKIWHLTESQGCARHCQHEAHIGVRRQRGCIGITHGEDTRGTFRMDQRCR